MTEEVALCGRGCYYIRLSLFSCSLWGFASVQSRGLWLGGETDNEWCLCLTVISNVISFFVLIVMVCCIILVRGREEKAQTDRKIAKEADSYREPPVGLESHKPLCCKCVWFVDSQWVSSWSTWQPCTEEYGGCHDHTAAHTQPYAPIVIPMSSDNIHFPLLSASAINANPMWRGPGQQDDSLQSGRWHTERHKQTHTHACIYTHTHPAASLCSSYPSSPEPP